MGIAKQNIIFALAVKILVLILAAVGIASMWQLFSQMLVYA